MVEVWGVLNAGQNSKTDYCGNLKKENPDRGRKASMEKMTEKC